METGRSHFYFLERMFSTLWFPFCVICVFIDEVCPLETTNSCWILFFSQSDIPRLYWWLEVVYTYGHYRLVSFFLFLIGLFVPCFLPIFWVTILDMMESFLSLLHSISLVKLTLSCSIVLSPVCRVQLNGQIPPSFVLVLKCSYFSIRFQR